MNCAKIKQFKKVKSMKYLNVLWVQIEFYGQKFGL